MRRLGSERAMPACNNENSVSIEKRAYTSGTCLIQSYDRLEAPVYDVTWEPGCRHTFVAATQDEAIHYVDTRAVGQLRTLYVSATGSSGAAGYRESEPASHAMARVAFDPRNPYLLAALQLNDNIVRLLDTRRPGHLVAELDAHDESVNGIAWRGSTSSEQTTGSRGPSLATVSDDCRVLLWDTDAISSPADMDGKWKSKGRLWRGAPTHGSILPEAAENVAWGVDNDFLAVTMGSRIRCMRI
jgi:WD40 repeat protein